MWSFRRPTATHDPEDEPGNLTQPRDHPDWSASHWDTNSPQYRAMMRLAKALDEHRATAIREARGLTLLTLLLAVLTIVLVLQGFGVLRR